MVGGHQSTVQSSIPSANVSIDMSKRKNMNKKASKHARYGSQPPVNIMAQTQNDFEDYNEDSRNRDISQLINPVDTFLDQPP